MTLKISVEITGVAPCVSVALATYNGEKYLHAQLDSILAQTYPPGEIVVVDDCSIDNTMTILEEYCCRFPKLITVERNNENIGYVKNFQKSLLLCRGDFIALCDQDDIWDPQKIATLVDRIGNADLIHSDARLIDSANSLITASFSQYSAKRSKDNRFLKLCLNNTVTGCTMLFRRSLLERAVPFPPCIPHDHWLALLAADGKGIAYYPSPLVSYRQHERNVLGAKAAHGREKKEPKAAKNWSAYIKAREEINDRRRKKFACLGAASAFRISERNRRSILKLEKYYASYFEKRIRVRAFLFHIFHLRIMSEKKTFAQSMHGLLLSLFGIGRSE
jgi:glycosyltransferase involved in cell wall biosynthesis